MHNLMSIVVGVRRAKTLASLLPTFLPEIDKVVNGKGAMLVLLDSKLWSNEDIRTFTRAGLSTHIQNMDGKQMYMVATQEMAGADAAFKRYADAKYPVTMSHVLSFPVTDHKGTVLATLQV